MAMSVLKLRYASPLVVEPLAPCAVTGHLVLVMRGHYAQ
jgi:hypothetical protein